MVACARRTLWSLGSWLKAQCLRLQERHRASGGGCSDSPPGSCSGGAVRPATGRMSLPGRPGVSRFKQFWRVSTSTLLGKSLAWGGVCGGNNRQMRPAAGDDALLRSSCAPREPALPLGALPKAQDSFELIWADAGSSLLGFGHLLRGRFLSPRGSSAYAPPGTWTVLPAAWVAGRTLIIASGIRCCM